MMKTTLYSLKPYEKPFLQQANKDQEIICHSRPLSEYTVTLAEGCEAVCCFVADTLDKTVLAKLSNMGIRLIALRSAGYDHVDMHAARELKLTVCNVPQYSPASIAEFSIAMILSLTRHMIEADQRIKQYNFLLDGLLGFDLKNKTVGIIGTGFIGSAFCRILSGFGCQILAYDVITSDDCVSNGADYVSLNELYKKSDIISLHCPLNESTHHLINQDTINKMKKGVMIINTSRGGVIDTAALIAGLESGQIGAAGLDVYENEGAIFYKEFSHKQFQDEMYKKLEGFDNVLLSAHQAYFTADALSNIFKTTINNITAFEKGQVIHKVE